MKCNDEFLVKSKMVTWNPVRFGGPDVKIVDHPEHRNPDGSREGLRCAAYWAVGRDLTQREIRYIVETDGIPSDMLMKALSSMGECKGKYEN